MKSFIIGTAGHIDHGKTAMVKALTGMDADRLAEEKRRGITIDLGFAHLDLPTLDGEALRLGFIDVPGHERFIRNMLAGVGGIDLVLFVIAADESIKPQTREHFDICRLLGVKRGITVLTKSDLVDPDALDVVKLEVINFLRGSFLDGAPIIPTSSLTGAGLDELKRELARVAAEAPAKDSQALARLPIDRVFSMKGFGTVVTGTLISGSIATGDELELFPRQKRARARGMQVYGHPASSAAAGQRTALNLAGVEKEELTRGMTLARPATFATTQRLDVQLQLLSSAKHPLKSRARVHFHSNTMETVAQIVLRDSRPVTPGAEVFARLILPDAALLLPGDRFIIRQFSPLATIGGGVVLDAAPVSRTLPADSEMQILAGQDRPAILGLRLQRAHHDGLSLAQLVAETGWTKNTIESELAPAIGSGEIVRAGEILMATPAWQILESQIVSAVDRFHGDNPLANGIGKEELVATTDAAGEIFDAIANALVRQKKLEIAGDIIRLPGRGVVMKDDEAQSKRVIEESFKSAGLTVPALEDVLSSLKVDKARAQKILTLLLRDKTLIKIADDLVFHHATLTVLKKSITSYKEKSRKINISQFKDLTGVSRKYAIPLLEYLDRERVTRRVGDQREIL